MGFRIKRLHHVVREWRRRHSTYAKKDYQAMVEYKRVIGSSVDSSRQLLGAANLDVNLEPARQAYFCSMYFLKVANDWVVVPDLLKALTKIWWLVESDELFAVRFVSLQDILQP
eukprot:GHVN01033219.1.p1 GENE.GHVN01033219.1~~GHVN01033219.1.p1  ORF type:complete len:114 (-),score=2.75 GHVN01033219.1:106-447(-)